MKWLIAFPQCAEPGSELSMLELSETSFLSLSHPPYAFSREGDHCQLLFACRRWREGTVLMAEALFSRNVWMGRTQMWQKWPKIQFLHLQEISVCAYISNWPYTESFKGGDVSSSAYSLKMQSAALQSGGLEPPPVQGVLCPFPRAACFIHRCWVSLGQGNGTAQNKAQRCSCPAQKPESTASLMTTLKTLQDVLRVRYVWDQTGNGPVKNGLSASPVWMQGHGTLGNDSSWFGDLFLLFFTQLSTSNMSCFEL